MDISASTYTAAIALTKMNIRTISYRCVTLSTLKHTLLETYIDHILICIFILVSSPTLFGPGGNADSEDQKTEEAAISRASLFAAHYFMSPMSSLFKAVLDSMAHTASKNLHEHVNIALTTCFRDEASYQEAKALVDKVCDDDLQAAHLLKLLNEKDAFSHDIIAFANGTMKDSDMPLVYFASILRYYVSTTCTYVIVLMCS